MTTLTRTRHRPSDTETKGDPGALAPGTWLLVRSRSRAGFSAREFRAGFGEIDAQLSVGRDEQTTLVATARTDTLAVEDPALAAVLGAPLFFDAERQPELRIEARVIRQRRELVELDGWLTVKGRTLPIVAMGTLLDGTLEFVVRVDRRQFGLMGIVWLPCGAVLGNELRLEFALAFKRRTRTRS